jgi:vancomycin resistance protein YoaR
MDCGNEGGRQGPSGPRVCYTARSGSTRVLPTTHIVVSIEDSSAPPQFRYTRYRSERRPARRALSKAASVVLLAVGAVVIVLIAAVVIDHVASGNKIHHGVSVDGVALGGLTPRQAAAKLATAAPGNARLVLTYGDKRFAVETAAVGARLRGAEAARAAYEYTRRGGLLVDAWRGLSLWVSGTDLQPTVAFDARRLRLQLDRLAAAIETKPVSAALSIKNGQLVVRPSQQGLALDRKTLKRRLSVVYVRGGTITSVLPVFTAQPEISTADAHAAADLAAAYLNGPLTLTYKDRSWTIPADKLAGYLAFVPGRSIKLRATFDSPTMRGYFRFITEQIGKPAKDASFRIVGKRVRVVPGRLGIGPAERPTVRNIEAAALKTGTARSAALVIGRTKPELTYKKAKALKITKRIGTYTTSVSGTPGRLRNVGLGASMLDGVLVAPGKILSVNATTGERTAAKGFQVAPVIINGQLEDSLGGGMCQVSTTLFNAAFEAGLQIVERHNHSLYISHYPLGRDATVSYGSYDLKIRNDTKNWVLVKSVFTGWSLTFSMYSAPLHRRVVSSVSGWYGLKPFPVVKKEDPTLAKGRTVIETPGVSGQSITCYRKVYDASGKLRWNDTFVSTYQVVPQVVLVGTKAKTSPSPSASGSGGSQPSPTATRSPKPSPSATH